MKTSTKTIFTTALISVILSLFSFIAFAQFPFNIGNSGNSDDGNAIATDASNNVYVTGHYAGTVQFTGAKGPISLTASSAQEDIYVAKYNSSGVAQWAFDIGSGGETGDDAYSIACDASGNVYITGSFQGTANFSGTSAGTDNLSVSATVLSNGGQDIFVAKYNTSGAYQWAFALDDPGTTNSDVTQADGVNGNSIALDASGNVYITGSFIDTVDFNPAGGDTLIAANGESKADTFIFGTDTLIFPGSHVNPNAVFVAKYNSDGAYQWAFRVNNEGLTVSNGLAIAIDPTTQDAVVTGYFTKTADFEGTSGSSNPLTVSGGSGFDAFVAKYTPAGVNVWAFNIGSASNDCDSYNDYQYGNYYDAGIAVDRSGNVLVTGSFVGTDNFSGTSAGPDTLTAAGNEDAFIAKYNSSGGYLWAFNIGSSGNTTEGAGIATDTSNDVLVTGGFQGTADFKGTSVGSNTLTALGTTDIFVAKYDSTGAYQCAFNVGSSGSGDNGNAIAADKGNNMLVTGGFQGTANFDPLGTTANLTSGGSLDAFVARYTNCAICSANAGVNQSICQGVNSSVTIGATAVSGQTYSWSPATGLSSSTVSQPTANPTATTTYTLTAITLAAGCQATSTVTVFVGAAPAAPVISGPTAFCTGGFITLTAGTGYSSYLWSNSATTDSIKAGTLGNYSVTVTNSAGCSAASSVRNITENSLPPADAGSNETVCPGTGTVIGTAAINGDTYRWSPASGLNSSTVSQPTASPTTTTTYTLTVTSDSGCTAISAVRIIATTLPATPVITASGPTTFCTGGSVTLNSGSGYTTYSWSNGGTTQSIDVSTQASYNVTVTNGGGCSAVSADTMVTVITPATPVITQNGDTLFCSITASSYQWYLNVSIISGATNQLYLPTQNGSYTITIEEGGCSSTSSAFSFNSAGINPVNADNELMIYPTPASDYFVAQSKTEALQSVTMYDVLGKRILSTVTTGYKVTRINIETLPSGVYFVQLKTNSTVSTLRLVKQ